MLVSIALTINSYVTSISSAWESFEEGQPNKARLLNQLWRDIGYGGIIHQLKNYVLRQDKPRVAKIKAGLAASFKILETYRTFTLTPAKRNCLQCRPSFYWNSRSDI
ncbi:MAG: hypothetical protein QF605_10155 [Rhodospirillales bacterium]|nr:hypothetical protein [Rhodospirillales bacterium]